MKPEAKEVAISLICFIAGCIVGGVLVYVAGYAQQDLLEKEAVKRGAAEYYIDEKEAPKKWRWKP